MVEWNVFVRIHFEFGTSSCWTLYGFNVFGLQFSPIYCNLALSNEKKICALISNRNDLRVITITMKTQKKQLFECIKFKETTTTQTRERRKKLLRSARKNHRQSLVSTALFNKLMQTGKKISSFQSSNYPLCLYSPGTNMKAYTRKTFHRTIDLTFAASASDSDQNEQLQYNCNTHLHK